jgi:transposase-like protein
MQVPTAEQVRAAQEEEQRQIATARAAQAAQASIKMVECPICNQVEIKDTQPLLKSKCRHGCAMKSPQTKNVLNMKDKIHRVVI